ncbi:hypothetical protein BKA81DRAFT_43304 [Phyllosticta paracitricarpa]
MRAISGKSKLTHGLLRPWMQELASFCLVLGRITNHRHLVFFSCRVKSPRSQKVCLVSIRAVGPSLLRNYPCDNLRSNPCTFRGRIIHFFFRSSLDPSHLRDHPVCSQPPSKSSYKRRVKTRPVLSFLFLANPWRCMSGHCRGLATCPRLGYSV